MGKVGCCAFHQIPNNRRAAAFFNKLLLFDAGLEYPPDGFYGVST
jgi:hypothetical protein